MSDELSPTLPREAVIDIVRKSVDVCKDDGSKALVHLRDLLYLFGHSNAVELPRTFQWNLVIKKER